MRRLRVLVACEQSGVVRDAFAALGHYAVSCDLAPSHRPGRHHTGDVFDIINDGWDVMVAHPPCTYLAVSGLHHNGRIAGREELTRQAIRFAERLWESSVPRVAIENPVGVLSTRSRLGPATQYIQPYEFGADASKKTGLWLRGLAPLMPTSYVQPRIVDGLPRWANQTDSGQCRLSPSADRWLLRSVTYEGIARAMAATWGRREAWPVAPAVQQGLFL